jgi:protoporphyrinogen oxidase
MTPTFAILGSGMAAFGAATALAAEGATATCYDKNDYFGGHTATFSHANGFIFDDGPHLSFTKNTRLQDLLADNVSGQYEQVAARINNYWHGYWLPHPAQCNLYGLPAELITRIVCDFVDAHQPSERTIRQYADWLEVAYGTTFAREFPMVYGLKYHTTSADNMSTDWLGPRMYRPSLAEVLRGALSADPRTDMHYVTHFRYPTFGGFAAYLRPFAERADIRLSHRLVSLDPSARTLRFENGHVLKYDRLVSSVPLPDLVACIVDAPADVRAAAGRLAFSTAVIVNLGIARADLSNAHISYVYDPDVPFARVNFPHMLSPHVAPVGHGSIQVEAYFSDKYRPLDCNPSALIQPVVDGLKRIDILRENDAVVFSEARVVRPANVIFDLERAEAVRVVQGFLDQVGVHYCGRYGNWDHAWTDEAFESGERAAHAALGR